MDEEVPNTDAPDRVREDRPRPRRPAPPPVARAEARELPHNLELEKAILAVLLDGRHTTAIHKVRERVPHPQMFFGRDHRLLYQACLDLDDQGHRIDATSVAELLSRWPFQEAVTKLKRQQELAEADGLDRLDRKTLRDLYAREQGAPEAPYEDSALAAIGGVNAVTDLVTAGAAAGLERNADLLRDYYLKRRLITRLQRICDKAYRTPEDFAKLVDESGQAVLDMGSQQREAGVHGVSSVVEETLKDIVERNANPDQGVRTGIQDVDERLMALRPGGLYVLAARPGVGKTSLALKIVANIVSRAENPSRTLFFSLEVDRVDLLKKLLAAESSVAFKSIESGAIDTDQWALINETAKRFREWPLDLMDVSDLTVNGLRSVVKRRMLESGGGLKLVVIDYLQLLNSSRSDSTEYEKVSEISRVLKVMARDLRIPVVALSQMSRDSEKGVGHQSREPRLSDLRGSGSIEQDADAVIFIHREGDGKDSERKIKVIVAKNRFGPTGFAKMWFFPEKMKFEQRVDAEEDDQADPAERQAVDRRVRRSEKPQADEDLFQ